MSAPECIENAVSSQSPFRRLIAFELYDGPVSGLVECESTGECLLFQLLAWDHKHHDRVFSLTPIGTEVARELIAALGELDDPTWPEWWLDANDSPEKEAAMTRLIEGAWQAAGRACCVIIASSLLGRPKGLRVIAEEERASFDDLRRMPPGSAPSDPAFESWQRFVSLT